MRKGRSVLLILIGLLVSYRLIKQVDHDFIFDTIINGVLVIVAIVIFAWNVIRDRKDFKQNKRWYAFLPSIIGLLIFILLSATLLALSLRDISPSKLYCVTKIVDFNGASIDFREDGTYKLTSWCLGADCYRGHYTIQDSIIKLDKKEIEKIIVSDQLLIRSDGEIDTAGNREKSIYQLDDNGSIIAQATDFRVIKK